MSTTEKALRGQFGDWTDVSVLTLMPNPKNQAQRLLSGSLPYRDPRAAGGLSSNHTRSQRTASRGHGQACPGAHSGPPQRSLGTAKASLPQGPVSLAHPRPNSGVGHHPRQTHSLSSCPAQTTGFG